MVREVKARAHSSLCVLALLAASALLFLASDVSERRRRPLRQVRPATAAPVPMESPTREIPDFDFFDGRAASLLQPLQPPLQEFGILPGSFYSPLPLPTRRDQLPRIFPRAATASSGSSKSACIYSHTARQRSLFSTNVLALFGSGRWDYKVVDTSFCQFHGTCSSVSEAVASTDIGCDPSVSPTVMLVERIKNFGHGRFNAVLRNGMHFWDVVFITGDEFCRAHAPGTAHFRMYFGPDVVRSRERPTLPEYMPLGPREEFARVGPEEVKLVNERSYEINFIGTWTSMARDRMAEACEGLDPAVPKYVKLLGEWRKELTMTPGFIPPERYREVLLDSVFTLCPQGHNPEAYRMFEAIEAGSIPIVAMDAQYRGHECGDAYGSLRNAGAPFIFLPDWADLPAFLDSVRGDSERLLRMQVNLMEWYAQYMSKLAADFEGVLEARFRSRAEWNSLPPESFIPECVTDNGVPCRDPAKGPRRGSAPVQRCFGRC